MPSRSKRLAESKNVEIEPEGSLKGTGRPWAPYRGDHSCAHDGAKRVDRAIVAPGPCQSGEPPYSPRREPDRFAAGVGELS